MDLGSMLVPDRSVVLDCARHMREISDQLVAVHRYADREVLSGRGFTGLFSVLVPLLDRIAASSADGTRFFREHYAALADELVDGVTTLHQTDAEVAQGLALLAGGSLGGGR
ncbi:MAG: hypothetical protein WAW88_00025 [Nocardioides sp.]